MSRYSHRAEATHAKHELLATAIVLLCLGVAILPDYTPSSPSALDRPTD